ncbi:MAG: hypothetical protein D8H96_01235, partial [Lautropia sp.]
ITTGHAANTLDTAANDAAPANTGTGNTGRKTPGTSTQVPPGEPGVEIRRQKLALTTLSRLDTPASAFPATMLPANGWNTVLTGMEAQLQLPPGWMLLSASGTDEVYPPTWTSRWRLYDFFFMLLISLAAFQLLRPLPATVVMLAALLSWYDLELACFLLIGLLVMLGCLRLARRGSSAESWLRGIGQLMAMVMLLVLLPFAAAEIRMMIYPVLEHHQAWDGSSDYLSSSFGDSRTRHTVRKTRSTHADDMADDDGTEADTSLAAMDTVEMAGTGAADEATRNRSLSVAGKAGVHLQGAPGPRNTLNRAAQQRPAMPVQTGPGEPAWSWNAHTLTLHGDVQPDQTVSLHLLSPWGTRVLKLVRLLVLFGSLWFLFRALPGGRRPPAGMGTPPGLAALLLAGLMFTGLASNGDARAADDGESRTANSARSGYRASELQAIRDHLYPAPACAPRCSALAQMRVQAGTDRMTLLLLVHAQALVQVPLPAHDTADNWRVDTILLDGQPATTRRDEDGLLWALVPAGIHTVQLQGPLGQGTSIRLPLPSTPGMLQIESAPWTAEGLNAQGIPQEGVLTLSRQAQRQAGTAIQVLTHVPDALPGFVQVDRTLMMDERWRMVTRISRRSVSQAPVRVRFALLPGESVNDERVTVRDGVAELSLGLLREMVVESTLPISPAFDWRALPAQNQIETWSMRYGPTWHLHWQGVPPTQYVQGGRLLPRWTPWPGETLHVRALQPVAIAGPTLTLESEQTDVTPGAQSTLVKSTLVLRASLAGTQRVQLPDQAVLLELALDGTNVPLQVTGQTVDLPVLPGSHELTLRWRQPVGTDGIFNHFRTQALSLPLPGVNAVTRLSLPPSRVVLLTGGPDLGPAVRFWGLFLLLGVAPMSLLGALLVAGWFFALAWLPHRTWLARRMARANGLIDPYRLTPVTRQHDRTLKTLVPWLLGLLSFVALAVLFSTIKTSLLGYPDLLVTGNGSTHLNLNWYQDRFADRPESGWAITVSLTAYRVMMLAWALWLAFSVLKWIRWGWQRVVAQGYAGTGDNDSPGGDDGPGGPGTSGGPGRGDEPASGDRPDESHVRPENPGPAAGAPAWTGAPAAWVSAAAGIAADDGASPHAAAEADTRTDAGTRMNTGPASGTGPGLSSGLSSGSGSGSGSGKGIAPEGARPRRTQAAAPAAPHARRPVVPVPQPLKTRGILHWPFAVVKGLAMAIGFLILLVLFLSLVGGFLNIFL